MSITKNKIYVVRSPYGDIVEICQNEEVAKIVAKELNDRYCCDTNSGFEFYVDEKEIKQKKKYQINN